MCWLCPPGKAFITKPLIWAGRCIVNTKQDQHLEFKLLLIRSPRNFYFTYPLSTHEFQEPTSKTESSVHFITPPLLITCQLALISLVREGNRRGDRNHKTLCFKTGLEVAHRASSAIGTHTSVSPISCQGFSSPPFLLPFFHNWSWSHLLLWYRYVTTNIWRCIST